MKTSKEALANYDKVNDLWTNNGYTIRFGDHEGKVNFKVAKQLLRALWEVEVGTKFPFSVVHETSGRNNTWVWTSKKLNTKVVKINTSKGWGDIIHSWSHYLDRRINPKSRPHSSEHSMIELRCTKYFFDNNYPFKDVVGEPVAKLRINKVAQRYERMLKRQIAWEAKLKRAETHLAKVQKEIKRYEKVHSKEKLTSKYLNSLPKREPKEKINWELKVQELANEYGCLSIYDDRFWDGYQTVSDRYVEIAGVIPYDYDQLARNKTWKQWYDLVLKGLAIYDEEGVDGLSDNWSMEY